MTFATHSRTELLLFDRMALLLNTWYVLFLSFSSTSQTVQLIRKPRCRTALLLGILYLAFQAFPVIFQDGYHFNTQSTGMSFLGIGLGMLLALSTQPFWNRSVYQHLLSCHKFAFDVSVQLLGYSHAKQRNMVVGLLQKHGLSWAK